MRVRLARARPPGFVTGPASARASHRSLQVAAHGPVAVLYRSVAASQAFSSGWETPRHDRFHDVSLRVIRADPSHEVAAAVADTEPEEPTTEQDLSREVRTPFPVRIEEHVDAVRARDVEEGHRRGARERADGDSAAQGGGRRTPPSMPRARASYTIVRRSSFLVGLGLEPNPQGAIELLGVVGELPPHRIAHVEGVHDPTLVRGNLREVHIETVLGERPCDVV
jgi:hypothetical protein